MYRVLESAQKVCKITHFWKQKEYLDACRNIYM